MWFNLSLLLVITTSIKVLEIFGNIIIIIIIVIIIIIIVIIIIITYPQ